MEVFLRIILNGLNVEFCNEKMGFILNPKESLIENRNKSNKVQQELANKVNSGR